MARHFMGAMYHRPGDSHYHSQQDCSVGKDIPIDDREAGPDGLPLCEKCAALKNRKAKARQREDIARRQRR